MAPLPPYQTTPSQTPSGYIDSDDIFRMHGPLPDKLIIAQNSPFHGSLLAILDKYQKRNCVIEGGGTDQDSFRWIRDPLIRTSRGLAHASLDTVEKDQYRALGSVRVSFEKYQSYIDILEKQDEIILQSRSKPLSDIEKRFFRKEFIQFQMHHNLYIAGGNLIKATNKDGKLIYIVGLVAVFRIMILIYNESPEVQTFTPSQQAKVERLTGDVQTFYRIFKTTKRLLRQFLINDPNDIEKRVIFIDQMSYHIDLDMVALPNGNIFVNSYESFLDIEQELFRSTTEATSSDRYFYHHFFEALYRRYHLTTQKIIAKLRKYNFNVFPLPLSSYIAQTEDFIFSAKKDSFTREQHQDWLSWKLKYAFSFTNGICIELAERDTIYLVSASQPTQLSFIPKLCFDLFHSKIQELQCIRTIETIQAMGPMPVIQSKIFGDIQEMAHPLTSEVYLLKYAGGLRCSVNKIPGIYSARKGLMKLSL